MGGSSQRAREYNRLARERLVDDLRASHLAAEQERAIVDLDCRLGRRAGEDYLRRCGVPRVSALAAFDDEVAGRFWESARHPQDREIGIRNLEP